MIKKLKIISSYVDWHWNEKTKKDSFYRYTKFSDDRILGEPVTREEYLREREW